MSATIHLREQAGLREPDLARVLQRLSDDDISEIEFNFILLYRLRKPRLYPPVSCNVAGCMNESNPISEPVRSYARFLCRYHSDLYASEQGKHFSWPDLGTFQRMRELGFFEWSQSYRERKRDKELRAHESIFGEQTGKQYQNRYEDIEESHFQKAYENQGGLRGSDTNAAEGTDHIEGQGGGKRGYWAPRQEWDIIQNFAHVVNAENETPVWDLWTSFPKFKGPLCKCHPHEEVSRETYEPDGTFHGYVKREVEGFNITSTEPIANRDMEPPKVTKEQFREHWSNRIKYGELFDPEDAPENRLSTPWGAVSRAHPKTQQMMRLYPYIFLHVRPETIYAGLTAKEQDAMRKIDQNEIQAMLSKSSGMEFERWDKRDLLAAWRDRKPRGYFSLGTTDTPKVVVLDVPGLVMDLEVHPFAAGAARVAELQAAFEPAMLNAFRTSIDAAYESVKGDDVKKDAMLLVNIQYGPGFQHVRETARLVEFSPADTPWYDLSDETMRLVRAILGKKALKPIEQQEIAYFFPDPFRTALVGASCKTSSSAPIVESAEAE